MSAYWPVDAATPWLVLALLGGTLAAGLGITRQRATGWTRATACALVVGATAGSERLCADAPAGFRMLAICAALLFAMKAVVAVEARTRLTPLQWFAFAALWPGMRPAPFTSLGDPALAGAASLMRHGLERLATGVGLVFLAWLIWRDAYGWLSNEVAMVAATVTLMTGLSLALHFGIFNVAAGAWRVLGVDCRPLFRAPLRSQSLTEFWSRRWNLAFSEMLTLAVYRPLVGVVGRPAAVFLSFLGSGVLHELAISVPVRAGYGLPTLYFALNGLLTLIEKDMARRGRSLDRLGWVARLWTPGWLVVPLPILFHPWFIEGVIWPMVGIS